MIDLDEASALRAADPSDMLGVVGAFADHVAQAYAAGLATPDPPSVDGVTSVAFCGMGGSAVAGDVLKQVFRDRLGVPIDVNRSPVLPKFAGPDTLAVVSSYSGDTSETLSAFSQAEARGCRIVAVTGGGALGAACAARGLTVVPIPGGLQPRAALGHLAFSMLGALESCGLLPPLAAEVGETVDEVRGLLAGLGPDVPTDANVAKQLAVWLGDRVPVVWGAEGVGSLAAMRWKTQLNENGKVPAWHAAMSELNHNEVVGWVPPFGEGHAVFALRHEGEHAELAERFSLTIPLVEEAGLEVREVHARGRSALSMALSLVVLGDMTSCYVGLRRGVDPTPVDIITRLKAALS